MGWITKGNTKELAGLARHPFIEYFMCNIQLLRCHFLWFLTGITRGI